MREIKNRGIRVDNGEWVYGYLLITNISGVYIIWCEKKVKGKKEEFTIRDVVNQCEVIPETVGQFTGLPDKNEKEIYEGDIVLAHRDIGRHIRKGDRFEVYYNEFLCHFALVWVDDMAEYNEAKHGAYDLATLTGAKAKYLEVVGTIHDKEEQS